MSSVFLPQPQLEFEATFSFKRNLRRQLPCVLVGLASDLASLTRDLSFINERYWTILQTSIPQQTKIKPEKRWKIRSPHHCMSNNFNTPLRLLVGVGSLSWSGPRLTHSWISLRVQTEECSAEQVVNICSTTCALLGLFELRVGTISYGISATLSHCQMDWVGPRYFSHKTSRPNSSDVHFHQEAGNLPINCHPNHIYLELVPL